MEHLANIHPGEILLEEFLKPYGISAYRLAKEINVPLTRIIEIVLGRRKITTDTALRLSTFFGNSAEFWLGIQTEFELREKRHTLSADLKKIHTIREILPTTVST